MTTLVLGATGFIGPALLRALRAGGEDAVAASRTGGGPGGRALDREDPAAVRALVREVAATTVIDLLAYTEADTQPLLDALDGEVDRYVMVSSADVYRNYEGLHRKATPEPILAPLDEASPLRRVRYPYRQEPRRAADASGAWMDDYDKIPLEEALMSRPGLGGVVVRLPMVFGPGDRQRRFSWVIRPMAQGRERLRVHPAWRDWRTTYGFVDDVASAIAAAGLSPLASGRTFNLGEDDPPTHAGWIARFAEALGWAGRLEDAETLEGPLAALDLRYSLTLDTTALRTTLGWREPTDRSEALARTIADERAQG